MNPITVTAFWDEEAHVWVAESNDVPGLVTGAGSLEELAAKLKVMIPELLEANGVHVPVGTPVRIEASRELSMVA
jgi:predicted RNase H-like HicB family nuclease